jgi:hypothetical protein
MGLVSLLLRPFLGVPLILVVAVVLKVGVLLRRNNVRPHMRRMPKAHGTYGDFFTNSGICRENSQKAHKPGGISLRRAAGPCQRGIGR